MANIIPFESDFEKKLKGPIGKPALPKPQTPTPIFTRGDEDSPPLRSNQFSDVIPKPDTGSKTRDVEVNLNLREQIDQGNAMLQDQFLSERKTGQAANVTPFNHTAEFRQSFDTQEIDSERLKAQAKAAKPQTAGDTVNDAIFILEQITTPIRAGAQIARRATERIPEEFDVGLVGLAKDIMQFGRDPFRPGGKTERENAKAIEEMIARLNKVEPGTPIPPEFPPLLESMVALGDAELEEPALAQLTGGVAADFTNLIPGVGFTKLPGAISKATKLSGAAVKAERVTSVAAQAERSARISTAGLEGLELLKRPIVPVGGSSDAPFGIRYVDGELKVGADSPVDIGNQSIGWPTHINDLSKEVITTDNKIVDALFVKTGIQPDLSKNTDVGKLTVAYQRALVNGDTMTDAALVTAFDAHATPFAGNLGRLLPINQEGIWEGTSRHVLDIMENGTGVTLTSRQTAMLTDMRKVVKEVENMRVAHGLPPIARNADGSLYFPRKAIGRDDLKFNRPSNPSFERVFEDMKDGIDAGVKYSNNPRKVLEAHMKRAYRDIALKQLDTTVKPHGLTPKALLAKMKPAVVQRYADAIAPLRSAQQMVRALEKQKQILTVTGPSQSAKRLRGARTKKLGALEEQLGIARQNVIQTQRAYNKAKRDYSAELTKAKTTSITKGKFFGQTQENINVAEWKRSFYPVKDAEFLNDISNLVGKQDSNAVFTTFRTTGNAIRGLSATADAALPLTHGLFIAVKDPVGWAKGSLHHYYAFFDPAVQGRYAKTNQVAVREMGESGVSITKNEHHQILEQGGNIDEYVRSLKGGNVLANVTKAVKGQSLGRFQAMYDTGLLVYRTELWKAMKPGWKESPRELAAYINNLTGGLDTRTLGVGAKQADVESMWLAFSPRLLRSTTAVFGDAFQAIVNTVKPGVKASQRQRQAFQSVATLTAAVGGFYVTSGIALGKTQEEILAGLNPLNGKQFLSHQINGDWIGVGGQVRSIIQGMTALAETIAPGGRSISELMSTDLRDNPLMAFWAGRGAVGANIAGSVIEGASKGKINALKYDDVDNLADTAKHIGKSALPFVIQGGLEGEKPLTLGFSFGGFRTSPETFSEERERVAPEVLKENGMSLTNSTTGEKLGFKDLPPRLQQDIDDRVESNRKEKDPRQTDIDARISVAFETAKETKIAVSDRLSSTIASNPGPTNVRKAIQDARSELFVVNRALFSERVQMELDERKQDETLLESLRTQYWTASGKGSPDTNDSWYEQRNELRESIIRSGREQGVPEGFIRERAELTDDLTVQAFLDKYDTDQEILAVYWQGPNLLVREQLDEESRVLWDRYTSADRINQANIIADFPGLRNVIKMRSGVRDELRVADPKIDVALIRWGYVSQPLTEEGLSMAQSLLR